MSSMRNPIDTILPGCLGLALIVAGCARRPDIMISPKWHATATGKQAIEFYDDNDDGKIDDEELRQCPGLLDLLSVGDTNSDGALSPEEISARIERYELSGFVLVPFELQIKDGGVPVVGVVVTMIPEKLVADTIEPATGVTDSVGRVIPTIDHPDAATGVLRGLRPGMYRCEISLKSSQGDEKLPAEYNTASKLGFEIGPGHHIDSLNVVELSRH